MILVFPCFEEALPATVGHTCGFNASLYSTFDWGPLDPGFDMSFCKLEVMLG